MRQDGQDVKSINEMQDALDKYNVEEKRKIREYLAENLPGPGWGPGFRIEERIPEPMDPECEVCVVIPAYNERDYILAPLEALARQRDVKPSQYEVIVVVNNPPAAAQKGCEPVQPGDGDAFVNNRRTLELLRHIKEEETGVLLKPGEQKIITAIKKSGLRLFAIDKSSPGKTLPEAEANVGGARNRGMAEAIERFYKYAGRNGIIVHTDADTCADRYYIRSLIDVFKERPRLVGVGGGIQTFFYDDGNEQKQEDMKDLVYARTLIAYELLLDFLFKGRDYSSNRKTLFVGCNMASRAFEAALVGGVPRVAGAEDTTFSEWLARVGEVNYVPKVMVSQGVRYSERTTTGYGTNMVKCSRQIKETGIVKAKTVECELMKYKLKEALKQAVLYQRTSVRELKGILTLNNESILHDEDLRVLSLLLAQQENRMNFGEREEVLRIWEKVTAVVEDKMETAPLVEAVDTLISIFCMVEQIKKEFRVVKKEKRQEIDENLSTLDYFLGHIFDNDLQGSEIDVLDDHIVSLLENSGTSYARRILEKPHAIRESANLIAAAKTKAEARENIKMHYLSELVPPEDDPILLTFLDLKAMIDTLEKLKIKKSVIEILFS